MIDLSSLNPEQNEAATHTEGPLLILAGAGSGKTKVLTYRIAFILDSGLAGPDNILAMTFTNKAAEEMKRRIADLLEHSKVSNGAGGLFWMGTFHSICVKILRRYAHLVGLSNNFTIYDSSDQSFVVKEAMKRLDISTKEFNPNAVHSYISSAKNELVDSEMYAQYAKGYFQEIVAKVYPEYQKVLRENNAVDFDDLLILTVQLFKGYKDILQKFQDQFKYILVDEYQDTNHAQYILISLLAKEYRNICCVGDDDQSIYAFRGATIKNILSFEKDYPEAKVVKLEQNYRSTKKILEASYDVISKNRARKDKKLWTQNTDGENITIYTARDEVDEGNWIVKKISELAKDSNYNNFAVLYRTNAQSRSLEESFIQDGIPYKIIGGVRFYERKEIKDILAYLRIIHNPKETTSLERIINVPRRGIGDKTVEEIKSVAHVRDKSAVEYLLDADDLSKNVNEFVNILKDLIDASQKMNVVDLINYVLDRSGYLKMLKDGTLENESRIENIKELLSVASKYKDMEPEDGLTSFLNEVGLLEGIEERDENIRNYVTLMTIHAAKGLEFDYVFVVGMEENLFPHSNSMMDTKEMEEERRLAYVAITRAKKQLFLTHTLKRKYFGILQANLPSRFVTDIREDLVEREGYAASSSGNDFEFDDFEESSKFKPVFDYKPGDRVSHEYFGKGEVKYINDDIIGIDFGKVYGVKELMLEYARLEKVG